MTILDIRLLPVAIALWIGAALGLHTRLGAWFMVCAVICAGLLALATLLRQASLSWVAACTIGLIIAALRVDAASPAIIADALADSGVVRVTVVLDAEPQRVQRRGFGGLSVESIMLARATLTGIETPRARWQTSLPVTVQWKPDGRHHAVGETVRGLALPRAGDAATRNAYWIRIRGPLHVIRPESRGAWFASNVRQGLARATDAHGGGDGAALLPGLVLGDTRAQSPQLVDDLRLSGLSHLTAVSGANLAIVLGALIWALQRSRLRRRMRVGVLLAGICGFVVVVQPQPSVIRAAVMGALAVFAMASGSRRASASLLWLSVVLLLVIDPFLAWQWGFALSVAATAGLILLGPVLHRALGRGPVAAALAVTLSAQLATFPLLLAMGRPPTWLSIPANIICEPLVAPATVIGFLASVVAMLTLVPVQGIAGVALLLASVIAWPGVRIADVIAWIAHSGVNTPLAIAPIESWWGLGVVLLAVVVLHRMGMGARAFALLLVFAMLFTSCVPDGLRRWPQDDWWYAVCDVGQGDSSVLNLGHGSVLVVDAGPDAAAERACLRQLGVGEISALVFTHFHADHVEGVRGAMQAAPIRRVFGSVVHEPDIEWERMRSELGVDPVDLRAGDVLRMGNSRITVLWPDPEAVSGDPNNGSLVLDVLRADGARLLLTGDADPAAQRAISLPAHGYSVLKVPHHGSRYQDPHFLEAADPALALISVGEGNDYGHPAADTVALLRANGARVLRTDLVGSIAVSVRGDSVVYTALSA